MDLKERRSGAGRHPWELARIKTLRWILSFFVKGKGPFRILDIGCGDGFVLGSLAACPGVVEAHGLDIYLSSGDMAVMSTAKAQYFNDPAQLTGKYNIILLCDVLEHIEADAAFLARVVHENAAPGALFMLTVPAHQMLFSAHDSFYGHRRRYAAHQFHQVIESSGLKLLGHGSLFTSLLLPRAVICFGEMILGAPTGNPRGTGGWFAGRLWTQLVDTIFSVENFILWRLSLVGLRLPGLTLWAAARSAL